MKITRLLSVKFLPLFFILLITTTKAGAQLPIFDKITGKAAVKDTVSKVNEITLETVNAEIEYTDNLLFKRKVNEFDDGEQLLLIHNIDSFNVFITKQGQEFKSFSSNKIWRFYLINERVNWEEYQDRLRDYQKEIQKEIRNLQETQSYYSSNYYKWKQSLPVIEKDLSPQILNYVLSNLEKLKQVDDFYDKRIKELVSKENKIVQDVVYTDGILREINAQILKRKNELFKKNEPNIFETKYKKSFSGSFSDRIQLAFYENTKNFGYFADIIRRNFISYLVFFSFLIGYLLFIRKKFKGLNLSSEDEEFKFFNHIIVELPAITLIIIIIILWNLFTPYTPFIISLLLYLLALVLLYIVFAPIVSAILKKITLLLIVLFIIANLEVFAWYFGNYSRFYLLLESIAGIVISNKYILPINKTKYFSNQNRKVTFYTRAIAFAIFILSITGLLANLTGNENLAGYSNKLGIFTGLISILAFGFHRLLYSLFGASIHVLNIYYPDLVAKHGDNILRRTNRY